MPWTKEKPPSVAEQWGEEKRMKCVSAANAVMADSGDEEAAIFACMHAAGEGKAAMTRAGAVESGYLKFASAISTLERIGFGKGYSLDAEIFAVGTWNKTWKFTHKDLEQIAATFTELQSAHKVPLKFGHNDDQGMTDGYPALGWVTRVWAVGDKLMAHFENIPPVVFKAMEAKLYRHVSVELDVDVEHKGKKYKYVLSAVALLGADIPAVNTLKDLTTYLDGGARLAASRREVFNAVQGSKYSQSEEDTDMTKEEIEAAIKSGIATQLAPVQEQLAKFTTENSGLKAANEKLLAEKKQREETEQVEKIKMHRTALIGQFETAVKEKRILPAQRESALKFMRINDDTQVLSVTAEQVKEYIDVNGNKAVKFTQQKEQGRVNSDNAGNGEGDQYDDAGAEVVRRAKKLMSEDAKLSFSVARDRVLEGDPELGQAWLTDAQAA